MEKIKQLLKITSEYRSHKKNIAKEYAFLENGEFLTLGIECLIFEGHLFKIVKTDDSKLAMSRVVEKYTLCYGVSLTNIITLLSNKKVLIIGVNTFKDHNDNRQYFITIQRPRSSITESFFFNETNNLESFEQSDLGYILFDLYDIKL